MRMRTAAVVLILSMICGCGGPRRIMVRPGGWARMPHDTLLYSGSVRVETGPAEDSTLSARQRRVLEIIFRRAEAELERKVESAKGKSDANEDKYVASAIVESILEMKDEVRTAVMDDSRFESVKLQIEKAFRDEIGESHLQFDRGYVTKESVTDLIRLTRRLFTMMLVDRSLRVSFYVITEPDGARFELCPAFGTDDCIPVTSNARIVDVYRGRYLYRISKSGYKEVMFPLNLVTFSQVMLHCTLVPIGSDETLLPCTPR
jgi:hypothetical protein